MCRLAAYFGPVIQLDRFLLEPEHSLQRQAWEPLEMDEARMNADGFGFGWYLDGIHPEKYINTCPIWSDVNLRGLSRSLSSAVCLANVRSATPGQAISLDNTQPFISEQYMYLHNGLINGFGDGVRANFHDYLSSDIQSRILGNTDSEYLFALFRQNLRNNNNDLLQALTGMMEALPHLLDGAVALINLIITDGKMVMACRRALNNGKCPTLYFTDVHPDFPEAILVASERLSAAEVWEPVRENSLLVVTPEHTVNRVEL